jgi:hypothetical protein
MRRWTAVVGAVLLVAVATGCTTIMRGNVASNGTAGNGGAFLNNAQVISDDGRYVVFYSPANNLVPDDTNGHFDVFRHDNVSGTTVRVSVTDSEGQIPADSLNWAISGDGNHVAFTTDAALEAADTNGAVDVYVRTVSSGRTERVSIQADGSPFASDSSWAFANVSLSDNGNKVLMSAKNGTTGAVILRDRAAKTTAPVAGLTNSVLLSGDGNTLVLTEVCLNGDTCTHRTTVGAPVLGAPTVAVDTVCGFHAYDVSADGRYVLGQRFALPPAWTCPTPNNLVRWDRTTGAFTAVPLFLGLSPTLTTSISNDGRFVANVGGDLVVRVVDLVSGVVQFPDANAWGVRGPGPAFGAGISGNGTYTVIDTNSRLTPDDGNDFDEVYTTFTMRPTATSFSPATLPRGADHVAVTITGSELLEGLTAGVAGQGVHVSNVSIQSPTKAIATISVDPDAPTTARNVVVSNTGLYGTSDGLCVECLTVG